MGGSTFLATTQTVSLQSCSAGKRLLQLTVQDDALRSQGKHTPFSGYELPGQVRATLVGGQVAFERG